MYELPQPGSDSDPEILQFLTAGQLSQHLETIPGTTAGFYPHLHNLLLPGSTRLFPEPYIQALQTSQNWAERSAHPARAVRAFAGSQAAHESIVQSEQLFAGSVNRLAVIRGGDSYVTTPGITALLGINRHTVSRWHTKGYLDELSIEFTGMGHALSIPVPGFHRLCRWQRPKTYESERYGPSSEEELPED